MLTVEQVVNAYGCDPEKYRQSVLQSTAYQIAGIQAVLIGLLGDVQELLLANRIADACRKTNLIKFLVETETSMNASCPQGQTIQ